MSKEGQPPFLDGAEDPNFTHQNCESFIERVLNESAAKLKKTNCALISKCEKLDSRPLSWRRGM